MKFFTTFANFIGTIGSLPANLISKINGNSDEYTESNMETQDIAEEIQIETTNLPEITNEVEVEQSSDEEFYDVSDELNESGLDYIKYGKKTLNACVTTSIFGLFTTLVAARLVCNVSVAILRETLLGISNTCAAYTYSNKESESNALKTTLDFLSLALKGGANLTNLIHHYTVDLALRKLINELIEPYLANQLKIEGAEKDSYSEIYNNYLTKGLETFEKTPDALNEIAKDTGLAYKSCLALPESSKIKAQ